MSVFDLNNRDFKVLVYITAHGFSNQRSMAEECGMCRRTVARALSSLLSEGFLTKDAHGDYQLANVTPVSQFVTAVSQSMTPVSQIPKLERLNTKGKCNTTNTCNTNTGKAIDSARVGEEVEEKKSAEERELERLEEIEWAVHPQEMARFLYKSIKQMNPNHNFGNSVEWKWPREFRRMVEQDDRDPQEAMRLLKKARADSFWKKNILSPSKFREQYDKLWAKLMADESQEGGEDAWAKAD